MTFRNRHLLAVALGTAMIAPLAAAQDTNTADPIQAGIEADAAVTQDPQATEPALPPQANPIAEEQQPIDPRLPVAEEADDAWGLTPPLPEDARGAEHAADHSRVVQRSVWEELDADADGRVSAEEGAIDADFANHFEAFDSDGDGFVTDAEYRAGAKAEHREDAVEDDGARDSDDSEDSGDDADGDDQADPLDDRDGMDDDGTGMDEQDGGNG